MLHLSAMIGDRSRGVADARLARIIDILASMTKLEREYFVGIAERYAWLSREAKKTDSDSSWLRK